MLTGAGYAIEGAQTFMRAYLVGFWMWFGASAGCLGILMIQYLTGGAWGIMIRRPLEAGAKTLFVMMFFFLPLLIFSKDLYVWTTPAGLADPVIVAKNLYLNIPFLWGRWAIYLVFFLTFTFLLRKWSVEEDETKSMAVSSKLETLSAPGVFFFFMFMTFCCVDYMMTLEPHWYSTVYGFMLIIGGGLSALSAMIIGVVLLAQYEPFKHLLTQKHLHDLGKLLLAFTMLWAYLNFSQLKLITWSGKPAGRDHLVHQTLEWRVGNRSDNPLAGTLRAALPAAALAAAQEESEDHHGYCDLPDRDPYRRCLLPC